MAVGELPYWLVGCIGFLSASVGAVAGFGGAVVLVPLLVLLGVPPTQAAPLGLLSVAAGSLAAAFLQVSENLVNHRLGVVIELTAASSAFVGAWVASVAPVAFLVRLLGAAVTVAALSGLLRLRGQRRPATGVDERPNEPARTRLSGHYRVGENEVSYAVRRLPLGLTVMAAAGFLAGAIGAGGGFLKTPCMSELMGVPVKIASATSTFTVGITASAALVVFAAQGHLHVLSGAAIVVGALGGGAIGARVQTRLEPQGAQVVVSFLLAMIGVWLLVRP